MDCAWLFIKKEEEVQEQSGTSPPAPRTTGISAKAGGARGVGSALEGPHSTKMQHGAVGPG